MTTAREITAMLREIWAAPVRLQTSLALDGTFRVKVSSTVGNQMRSEFVEDFLARRIGAPVSISLVRKIRRRDCGTDHELRVKVGR